MYLYLINKYMRRLQREISPHYTNTFLRIQKQDVKTSFVYKSTNNYITRLNFILQKTKTQQRKSLCCAFECDAVNRSSDIMKVPDQNKIRNNN